MTHGLAPIRTAVVHPVDGNSLRGAVNAAQAKLIIPIFVGPEAKIRAAACTEGIDLAPYELIATRHSHEAAERAVALARTGKVEALMKGSLHTDELMHEVVAKDIGPVYETPYEPRFRDGCSGISPHPVAHRCGH